MFGFGLDLSTYLHFRNLEPCTVPLSMAALACFICIMLEYHFNRPKSKSHCKNANCFALSICSYTNIGWKPESLNVSYYIILFFCLFYRATTCGEIKIIIKTETETDSSTKMSLVESWCRNGVTIHNVTSIGCLSDLVHGHVRIGLYIFISSYCWSTDFYSLIFLLIKSFSRLHIWW